MLKKLVVASICAVALATTSFAAQLKVSADIEAYFKSQTDHRSPFDSADYLEANGVDAGKGFDDGNNFRSGANNRSHQNVRAHGNVDFIGLAGENDYQGTPWYSFVGFMRLKIDANDPDNNEGSDSKKDGAYADKSDLADLWIRWAPAPMVGIKIGTQSILATANAYGIGYKFVGDKDDDYIYYTSSLVDEKPGISVDVHLSKDIEFGVGMLQGMGDLSMIVSGGDPEQARNTVAWFKGNFGMVEATVGYQSIAVGDKDPTSDSETTDEVLGEWKHEHTHTLLNAVLKFNIGDFSPFIGYQAGSGDAAVANDTTAVQNAVDFQLPGGDSTKLNNRLKENREIKISAITAGLLAKLGPGKLAAEYTLVSTPEWGEEGYVSAAMEIASTIHLNYQIPFSEDASITFFYNSLTAKEDDNLRDDIDYLESIGGTSLAKAYGASFHSSHTSVGVSFQMNIGN